MKWLQALLGFATIGASCAYMVAFNPLPWPQWLAGCFINGVGGALIGNAVARLRRRLR